jgi:L-threonylcarbamoyladenylate synthase
VVNSIKIIDGHIMERSIPNKIFIYPTDTVWGIGGSIFSKEVYDRINKIKGVKGNKPVSVLFPNINLIKKYFMLPLEVSDEWLRIFFKFETTLGLPLSWHKGEIPSWVYQNSKIICVRCLEGSFYEDLTKDAGGPIITTSLNLSGAPPLASLDEIYSFKDKYVQDALIKESFSFEISGHSSSIISVNDSLEFHILREGFRFENVKQHLRLLSA